MHYISGFMATVTLSSKSQIVIPKKVREDMDWKPGEKLVVIEKGNSIELVKVGPISKARGLLRGTAISWREVRDHRERFG